jgi:sarcosine oxidase subunit beta
MTFTKPSSGPIHALNHTGGAKTQGRCHLRAPIAGVRSAGDCIPHLLDDEGLGHEDEQVTPAVLAGIAQCLVGLFPALDAVRVVRCWAGIMGFTADGLPLIGRWEQLSGLTVAAGFNGNGFSWAAITGRIVADLVTGQTPAFDRTPFDPNRFFTAGTAWANPFTQGEKSTLPVA